MTIVLYHAFDWVAALMTTRVALAIVLSISASDKAIPWDQTLVDRTIQDISDPTTKIRTLAYKATALAKLGQTNSARKVARDAQELLEQHKASDPGDIQLFGDWLCQELAVAFEWINDKQVASDVVASIRNPYKKSEALAEQAVAATAIGDRVRGKQLLDAAMEQLKEARGAFLGGLDIGPAYAAIDPALHKEILIATDATLPTLIDIARCQYESGLTTDSRKTSKAVVTFLMDQASRNAVEWPADEVATWLTRLLFAIPGDRQLVQKIEEIARNFSRVGSGLWEDTVDIGEATLWPAIGKGWAELGEHAAAKAAFAHARELTEDAHKIDDYVWPLCSLASSQMDVGFYNEAHADIQAFMQHAGPLAKDISPQARGELAATLVRLGRFEQAEVIFGSEYPIDVWPNRLAKAAVIGGNIAKAFEYARLAEDEHPYFETLEDIVRAIIGPPERLGTYGPRGLHGGIYLMSILMLVAFLSALEWVTEKDFYLTGIHSDSRITPLGVTWNLLTAA